MAQSQFKGFAGVAIRGDRLGDPDDPLVLLVHGGGQTRGIWNDAATALVRAGRQVIAIDLRGHGESEWPVDARYDFGAYVEDLRAILAQLPSRPVIVGASLGGWVAAVAIGEDGGHLASGLILVDAPPDLDLSNIRKTADALRAASETAKGAWDPRMLDRFHLEDALIRFKAAAPNIRVPALFVRGALSDVTDAASAGRIVDQIPGAEYAEIGHAGHLVASDRGDLFSATLLDFLERRIPRFVPEYRSGSDARTLRDALGCFATGVTVVTAFDENGVPAGLTANSFTSVSLDPPLLLVCIAKTSSSLKAIETTDHFAVNVLHIGQQPASSLFALPGEDRFRQTPWKRGRHNAPILSNALASFECRRHQMHDGGDHIILVGEVLRATFDPRRDPLLYFRGKYRRLHFS
jgi:flavin reductase (DIM6/NTAB) family NADH-FMN oxidoreductase RutF/pimeloyl-ACP methyl ester carboxylesterase